MFSHLRFTFKLKAKVWHTVELIVSQPSIYICLKGLTCCMHLLQPAILSSCPESCLISEVYLALSHAVVRQYCFLYVDGRDLSTFLT